jgi:hypothetical protein
MAGLTTILLGVGLATSLAGTAVQMVAAQKQAKAQKASIRAQQKAEAQRERQMNLDAQRSRREEVRKAQRARAQAVAQIQSQGAQGGSAVQGASGQIFGQAARAQVATTQNQQIGANIFAANRERAAADMKAADARALSSFGSGIASIGGVFMSNAGTFGRIGTFASSRRG